ncbi:hypothetical protein [Algibacter sp. Ld11]|uniref:hypothetical protein n=1 Tax=Algibacter sp. Ld11 TaxID=649150 RepID=UPI003865F148
MKTCIFCGKKPDKKTKEHVIPRWLIEMTGEPNRTTFIGKYKDTLRKFPWQNFTFPACNKCNQEFAELEGKAKLVFINLLDKKKIATEQINILLDWLDKVRIGLWLGYLMLDKAIGFKPNFHIKQRLGVSDRMVSIHYLNDSALGIGYSCTEFPAFKISPSCFILTINNISLFNFSMEFALSRRMGFPFPEKKLVVPNETMVRIDEFKKGNERIMNPIIRKPILKDSIRLYQSIQKPVSGIIPIEYRGKYYNDYMDNNVSHIYCENDFTKEYGFLEDILDVGKPVETKRSLTLKKLTIQTLEYQIFCLSELQPSFELLDKKEISLRNKFYRKQIQINQSYIKKIKQKR